MIKTFKSMYILETNYLLTPAPQQCPLIAVSPHPSSYHSPSPDSSSWFLTWNVCSTKHIFPRSCSILLHLSALRNVRVISHNQKLQTYQHFSVRVKSQLENLLHIPARVNKWDERRLHDARKCLQKKPFSAFHNICTVLILTVLYCHT